MAYKSDFIPDYGSTVEPAGSWFRSNQSRSGTPVSQEREIDPEVSTRPNQPLRTVVVETEMDRMVAAALENLRPKLLAAYAPPTKPPHLMLGVLERVEVTAMHGGAGRGERFIPPKRRR